MDTRKDDMKSDGDVMGEVDRLGAVLIKALADADATVPHGAAACVMLLAVLRDQFDAESKAAFDRLLRASVFGEADVVKGTLMCFDKSVLN